MATDPRCPKCHATVEPSWDWCMGCGYDPAGRKPADSDRDPGQPWSAPAPPGAVRAERPATQVTTLTGPGAAGPQEMRDPDWVQRAERRRLPVPALIGLLAVVAVAIGALIVVTLLVLHRPIGTTGGGALQPRPVITTAWTA